MRQPGEAVTPPPYNALLQETGGIPARVASQLVPVLVTSTRARWRWKFVALMGLAVLALAATAGILGFLLGSASSQPRAMLVPGTPDVLNVARYGPKPTGPSADTTPWTADADVNVTDTKRVARMAADANNLPLFPNGNFSCPYSDGSHYELQFSFANGDRRTLFVEKQGCQGVGFADIAYGSGPSIAWSMTDHRLLNDLEALFR
jgi:hypothetical protein